MFNTLRDTKFGGRSYAQHESISHHRGGTAPLIHNQQDIPLQTLNVAPEWIKLPGIDGNLVKIERRLEQLGKLYSKSSLDFDGNREDEDQIEVLTNEISTDLRRTHHLIKTLGDNRKLTTEEVKVRNNIKSAKSSKLQALSLDFRKKQRSYMMSFQKRSALGGWGGENEAGSDDEQMDFGFNDQLLEVVDDMEKQVTKRNDEIVQIARSINEMTALVNDISTLVIKQGTLLDQIEFNLDQTEQHVEESTFELAKRLGVNRNMTQAELKLKKNIKAIKSARFQELTTEFKRISRIYVEVAIDKDEDEEEMLQGVSQEFINGAKDMEQRIAKRAEEINQIVKSINDLSQLMNDARLLVIQQGTIIDQIDYNLNQVEDNLIVAVKTTIEADKIHAATPRCTIC
eukprot:gene10869-12663_t